MFRIKKFIEGQAGFPSLLNYFEFKVEGKEGVLLNRDGSLLASFYYQGPDMDSSLGQEEDELARQLNNVFVNFGNGWSIHVDLIRVPANGYPDKHYFDNVTSILIEEKRKENFLKEGEHFENVYVISFTYRPSFTDNEAIGNFFVKNKSSTRRQEFEFVLNLFNQKF